MRGKNSISFPPPDSFQLSRKFNVAFSPPVCECIDVRTLNRCWTDSIWPSYKIRICIPKPGVIVWRRRRRRGSGVRWQPAPTLLDPRPPNLVPMARGLSYGTQGAAGVAPHTPLLGTIMASSGPAPVLRPVRRRFKLAILTVLSISNPHQQCSKDEMQSWDSLSLLSLVRPYLIPR